MFSFFEKLTQPFPDTSPSQPPKGLVAFCKYYTQGMWGVILTVSVLSAIVAMLEGALFGFLGQLVDWLTKSLRLLGWGLRYLFLFPCLYCFAPYFPVSL